ncbi:MAG: hypothetical protein P8M16_04170 [Acidimicrobiales bacterium]|nr:hypothetical protein [Acidimicrobiales bacterium]
MHLRIVVLNDQSLWPSTRKLGIYSTVSDLAHPWVAAPNVRLLLIERGYDDAEVQVDVLDPPYDPGAGDLVVDLRPYATKVRFIIEPSELRLECWPEC